MDNEHNETMNETENYDEFVADTTEDTSSGIVGKILIGGAALATGVAGGLIMKNKDRILEKAKEMKAAKAAKKLEKARARVAKLEAKQAKAEAEKE